MIKIKVKKIFFYRDMFFYTFALFFLVFFFMDEKIEWYEALTMIIIYIFYAIFMKYNESIEKLLKKHIGANKVGVVNANGYFKNLVKKVNLVFFNFFLFFRIKKICKIFLPH